MRYQDDHNVVAQSLREAQTATELALGEISKEQKAKQEDESHIARVRSERAEREKTLRYALLKVLDIYLDNHTEHLHAAFSTQEQRTKETRELEAFKNARHTDPEIARLCDQRDELLRFLGTALVPGVKEMLQDSLKGVENQIKKRFPGLLQVSDVTPRNDQIEELLYYCNRDGKAVFFLPAHANDWDAAETGPITERTSQTMCLVWNMIKELNLRAEEGDFIKIRSHPAFSSRFDLEEVAILEGFSVKCQDSIVLRFVLSSVPAELQEALSYED